MGGRGRRREFSISSLLFDDEDEDEDRANLIVNIVRSCILLGGGMRRRSEGVDGDGDV
jgi:hypothetical protein